MSKEDQFWQIEVEVLKEHAVFMEEFFNKSGALGSHELLYQEGVTENLVQEYTILYFFFSQSFPAEAFMVMTAGLFHLPDNAYRVEKVKYKDYLKSMRKFFKGYHVINGLYLMPPWEDIPNNEEKKIIINPSFAFGTGKHETTALMLQFLRDHIEPGAVVVDLGSGSGILAIASLVFGASKAIGIEVEEPATSSARENFKLNQEKLSLSGECYFYQGDFSFIDLPDMPEKIDMFVANILPEVFYQNEEPLKRYLALAENWALSGINHFSLKDFLARLEEWFPGKEFEVKEKNQWYRISLKQE